MLAPVIRITVAMADKNPCGIPCCVLGIATTQWSWPAAAVDFAQFPNSCVDLPKTAALNFIASTRADVKGISVAPTSPCYPARDQ
jgi:hypothetical protein